MWQLHAPLWAWGGGSMLLGLGFTFFSGATEAWLVDALAFTGHKGNAAQPFLLQLYGDAHAFGVSGLTAAVVAAAQIVAGLAAPRVRRAFARRTHVLIVSAIVIASCLVALSMVKAVAPAIAVLTLWSFAMWVTVPLRQTYLNGLIPSQQRATVVSFDNLMTSAGGVIAQPALGRVADLRGYAFSYAITAVVQLTSLPFLVLARRANAPSDPMDDGATAATP
jgi:predicted MFS family arabinose efflux permease